MPLNHIAAWDARDRLVQELRDVGGLPLRTLYIRRDDGGTLALGLLPERRGIAMVEWRNDSYELAFLRDPALETEPYEKKSVGFNGIFGFGEKGSRGWLLKITEQGKAVCEAVLLPRITAFADLSAKKDKFLCGRRLPSQIPLWQLIPEDQYACSAAILAWQKLLREGTSK